MCLYRSTEKGTEDYTAGCYDSYPAGSGEKWEQHQYFGGKKERAREGEAHDLTLNII